MKPSPFAELLKVSDAYLKRLEDVLSANSTTPPPDRLSCYTNEQISFVVETWKEYSGHRQKIILTAFVKERINKLTIPEAKTVTL